MIKKLAALLCGILSILLMAVPVYADDGAEIIIGNSGNEGEATMAVTAPVSISVETIDGAPAITKVYELPQGADKAAYTVAFEQDGFLFTRYEASERVQEGQVDTKTMTQTKTVDSENGKVADIVAEAVPVVLYSEDGYTGELMLDVTSIVVEEKGTTAYSYRVEDVREYTNLDRNDAAYIPKTVLQNSVTLQLENIEWVVMGTYPVDGRMMPNLFKAIATYAGTTTGSRATGYTAVLTYTGEVTKTTPGLCVYTVVFRGEPVQAISDEAGGDSEPGEPQAESGPKAAHSLIWWLGIVVLSAACLVLGLFNGARIVQRVRGARDSDDTDFTGFEDDDNVEPDPELSASTGKRPFESQAAHPPCPSQTYPQDEFSIDDLFNEEGFFREDE